MPTISQRLTNNPALGELLILSDERVDSSVILAPARGAIVTQFSVAGQTLLYLDESTLNDAAKNVRGGIPVLFPSPGKLESDQWQHHGHQGTLKQHGFARTLAWQVRGVASDDDAAVATLALHSNATTLAQYPWEFVAELAFTLRGACLRISARVRNTSRTPMPYGLGFHPYFQVTDKARAHIDTNATTAFDNVTKKIGAFTGIDFTKPEVDLRLMDQRGAASALQLSAGRRIEVRASNDFTQWVVWSLADKDFICLEPWTAPGNALNTAEHLIILAPGAIHESWIEIELVSNES